MTLTLKQLESFVWVADLGSFRRAAERLNTTQPNISSRIAALEQALGVSLMARDAGSVRLTDKGTELLEKARQVLAATEAFVVAAGSNSLHSGALRLGVTEMVAHTWLGQFLKLFKQNYPNVMLDLSVDLAANLEQELGERSLDLTFQSGPFTHAASGQLELGAYPMVWVAAADSSLLGRSSLAADDLIAQPIVTHAKNTLAYQQVSAHFLSETDKVARLVPSANLMASVQMVTDGYGIGVLLLPLVKASLASGTLVELDYKWRPKDLAFYARYENERSNNVVRRAADLAQGVSRDFIQES